MCHFVELTKFSPLLHVGAKAYLEEKLAAIKESFEGGLASVSIEKVGKIEGEVDVNQRKGKIMYFYELALEMNWICNLEAQEGISVKGSVTIPEFSNEESFESCEIQVRTDDGNQRVRELAIKHLVPHIRKTLQLLLADLETIHGSSIQVGSKSGSKENIKTDDDKLKKSNANYVTGSAGSDAAEVVVETIHETISFGAPKNVIYDVFVDPAKVQGWTRGSAQWTPQVNTNFSFFGGSVQGTVVELIPGEKIALTWRLSAWPKSHSSIVALTFADDPKSPDSCLLTLNQSNVPRSDLVDTKSNWSNYYFNPIKNLFGF